MIWFVFFGCPQPAVLPSMPVQPVPEEVLAPSADGVCDVRVYVGAGVGPTELLEEPAGTVRGAFAVLEPLEGGISAGPILRLTRPAGDGVWFEVAEVEDYTLDAGAAARGPSSGWVRRSGLEVDLALSELSPKLMEPPPVHLRANPSGEAPIVRTYLQEPHRAEFVDCKGGWLKVRVVLDVDGSTAEGWLAPGDHCGHPFTTCG